MDATFRTPLLDAFRRGEAARDVRLLAAQGALAPRRHEQLGLLMLLIADQDPEIAAAAEATLQSIPASALAPFLARTDVPAETRSFFARRGVEPAGADAATEVDTPFIEVASPLEAAAPDAASAETGLPEPIPGGVADDGEAEHIPVLTKIRAMNVAQRIALAMKGTREERAILVRDPNKIVGAAVLSSPKITDGEVEAIARMANVAEEILRMIAQTRAWMKNYAVVAALTRNPKTPVALSMNLLSRLNDRDLRMLSSDRNVPDVLRITARKKLVIEK